MEVREAAKPPAMYRTASYNKNYLGQNVNVEVEKSCHKGSMRATLSLGSNQTIWVSGYMWGSATYRRYLGRPSGWHWRPEAHGEERGPNSYWKLSWGGPRLG